jgi:hypothetical protein
MAPENFIRLHSIRCFCAAPLSEVGPGYCIPDFVPHFKLFRRPVSSKFRSSTNCAKGLV